MNFSAYLTRQRNRYSQELVNSRKYKFLSALTFQTDIEPLCRKYVRGKVLDAGAGRLNAKTMLTRYAKEYVSFDVSDHTGHTDIVGDIQHMKNVPDETFDTVYCSDVIEHIPEPQRAIEELYRVLKRKGTALISTPHLSGLHEEPDDFYRFTPYGLRHLVEKAGFQVQHEARCGGILGFLFHPVSFVLTLTFWPVPLIRWIFWGANVALFVLPVWATDKLLNLGKKFPANVVIVASKP